MAYSKMPTITTGYIWTAANHNKYVKDNFAAGVPGIFTTKGDLVVATAADLDQRVAVGANGDVLCYNPLLTGGIKWGAARLTVLTLSTDTGYLSYGEAIDWDTELKDDFSGHNVGGSYVNVKGVCIVGCYVHYYADARDGTYYPGIGLFNGANTQLVAQFRNKYTEGYISIICIDDFGSADTVEVHSLGGGGAQQFKIYSDYSQFWVWGLG